MPAGTELEAALAAAAVAFYTADLDGYRARLAKWGEAQNAAYEAHHQNIDAAALAALARLATAPGGPAGTDANAAAGDLLDRLYETAPNHPGVIHYAIHAYDSPPLKDRGVPYAEVYDKTAPHAAHALHMPSHIFTRTGDWAASVDLNRRPAEAALEQSGDLLERHYVHALDYMIYGYLQMGEAEKAAALVKDMLGRTNHQVSFGGAYALAASPVRLVLEQEDWAAAAALSHDLHPSIPWDAFPQAVAILWFAKGLGAARSGDVEAARAVVGELGALRGAMLEKDQAYWAKLAEGQSMTVEAWIELAQGQGDLAFKLQRTAADIEDGLGKSPVTPGHVLPARELLGDMYAELGQADDAKNAYRMTLEQSPGRARSQAGLD
jgi:tetratricopeptide (TPR) repeat protein